VSTVQEPESLFGRLNQRRLHRGYVIAGIKSTINPWL